MDYEEIIMQIIVNSGNARSHAMNAIGLAKTGDIVGAREELARACDNLNQAHDTQTRLIQDEAAGKGKQVTLLMIHAQDHLMNAITVKDLAQEFFDLYEKLFVSGNS